jgi:pentose-5-phosphate-3-epimerase
MLDMEHQAGMIEDYIAAGASRIILPYNSRKTDKKTLLSHFDRIKSRGRCKAGLGFLADYTNITDFTLLKSADFFYFRCAGNDASKEACNAKVVKEMRRYNTSLEVEVECDFPQEKAKEETGKLSASLVDVIVLCSVLYSSKDYAGLINSLRSASTASVRR